MLHRIRDRADGGEADNARLKVWEMGETQQLHDDGPGGPCWWCSAGQWWSAGGQFGGRGLRECWKRP